MDSYLVGLVGTGIGPSLSPALHEREADLLGLRYLYRRLDLDDLGLPPEQVGDLLAAARLAGYDGLNVTHPCKQLVLPHLDELDATAAALGAVNTVVFRDGTAIGHNTDTTGFARAMHSGLPDVRLGHVVILGAGGAGAACAHALGTSRITVFDRDEARAASLVARLGDRATTGGSIEDAIAHADGLVHATPTGMDAHPGLPLPAELLASSLWVADVVYRPLTTALVETARARGCRVLDGGRMAVFQAADAFRLFTGRTPDADRMLRFFDTLEVRQ
ncbi:shikimate dehydrogenase [Actinophytocola algeriensis]|uniref:Shikimate dehydrogenase n=1 Tax=Actinophytocola algeriensis TaxID=1768010 RepID=A0A7W7Q9Q4_9PSEU|nr:shikimate dehydrogenase [Actinophytocola algeriensis]MBB4909610.1 shikimate dehydrogenase [Actinophytocola algeriensis]MBE1475600.1 shikimate dehydrogenase [Actinophytocola algeriensis]